MTISALAVGGGGREFSVAQLLLQTKSIGKVLITPGNGGFNDFYRRNIKANDISGIVKLAQDEDIHFVFVGPEVPLVAGLVDKLEAVGITAFGPSEAASQLEGSKKFAKELLMEIGAPTAAYECATDYPTAEKIIRSWGAPIVIKADGLCGGKGVKVAMTIEEALRAAHNCLVKDVFKEAGRLILIERFAPGREFSLHCICDGVHAMPLIVVRDYKRALNGDQGENTGGTGAYSPVPDISNEMILFVVAEVVHPVLRAMHKRGTPFKGCLYVGAANTAEGLMIYEFNVRFGDPETQVIVARHESGLVEAMIAASTYGGLEHTALLTFSDEAAVNVVAMAAGYPATPQLGAEIFGLDKASPVIHAGTRRENGKFFVDGGRVLNVVRRGKTVAEARQNAYDALAHVNFAGLHARDDIAMNV